MLDSYVMYYLIAVFAYVSLVAMVAGYFLAAMRRDLIVLRKQEESYRIANEYELDKLRAESMDYRTQSFEKHSIPIPEDMSYTYTLKSKPDGKIDVELSSDAPGKRKGTIKKGERSDAHKKIRSKLRSNSTKKARGTK